MDKIFLYLFFILFAKNYASVETDSPSGLIVFSSNVTRCSMFARDCSISFVIKNLNVLNDLKIISSNENMIKIGSIESCSSSLTDYKQCKNPNDFEQLTNHERHLYENNIHLVNLKPTLVGKISIEFRLDNTNYTHSVIVTQPKRAIDLIQQIYVIFFSLSTATIMGILIEWEKLKKILKMPIPVVVGFVSQYLFMPLLAFAFINLFDQTAAEALALFIYGCSPGGAGSNNWTIIFNGDIDLSVIMTFVSTMSSLCNIIYIFK